MKVVVVTGGIGSGKTAACRFLTREFGWPVYYADDRVKQLYVSSLGLLDAIEKELGGVFRDADGKFLPSELAKVIFEDTSALEKVESLVFPVLTDDFINWKNEQTNTQCVILESATILEKPQLRNLADVTVIIDAPADMRADRAAKRDKSTLENVRKRMKTQPLMNAISEGMTKASSDYVIMNDSDMDEFHDKLRMLAEKLS